MKTTTWPRIDIEKETESIIGLFYTRSLFFVCSIPVLYSLFVLYPFFILCLFYTRSLFFVCSISDLYSSIVLYLFPFAICEIFIYIELNHCYSNCLPNICMYASI